MDNPERRAYRLIDGAAPGSHGRVILEVRDQAAGGRDANHAFAFHDDLIHPIIQAWRDTNRRVLWAFNCDARRRLGQGIELGRLLGVVSDFPTEAERQAATSESHRAMLVPDAS